LTEKKPLELNFQDTLSSFELRLTKEVSIIILAQPFLHLSTSHLVKVIALGDVLNIDNALLIPKKVEGHAFKYQLTESLFQKLTGHFCGQHQTQTNK
jgi:hypothetical protein